MFLEICNPYSVDNPEGRLLRFLRTLPSSPHRFLACSSETSITWCPTSISMAPRLESLWSRTIGSGWYVPRHMSSNDLMNMWLLYKSNVQFSISTSVEFEVSTTGDLVNRFVNHHFERSVVAAAVAVCAFICIILHFAWFSDFQL